MNFEKHGDTKDHDKNNDFNAYTFIPEHTIKYLNRSNLVQTWIKSHFKLRIQPTVHLIRKSFWVIFLLSNGIERNPDPASKYPYSTYSSITSTTTDDSYSCKDSTKGTSSNLDRWTNSSFSSIGSSTATPSYKQPAAKQRPT